MIEEAKMIKTRRPVGLTFRTSSRSGQNNQCVAVASEGSSAVWLGDTKNGDAGPYLRFTRDQWALFLREVVHGLPSANNAVVVGVADMLLSYPKRGDVLTRWHVRSLATGEALHFDDGEWEAFRLGAADGEFGGPASPVPALAAS